MSSVSEQINRDIEAMLKKYNAKDCITKEEAINYFKNSGSKYPERSTTYLFKAMDLDHDGKISVDEIKASLVKEYADKLEDTIELDIESFFLKHDVNEDEKITKKEMVLHFTHLGTEKPEEVANKIFADIDTDKDGVITRSELKTYFKKKYNFGPEQ